MSSLSETSSSSSTPTLQTIPTKQLRPGMFLVRVLDSWWKSPFFTHRRLLKTDTEVQLLISSGIREVEIDLSLGLSAEPSSESGLDADLSPITSIEPHSSVSDHINHGKVTIDCVETVSEPHSEETQNREEILQLRKDVLIAVEGAFEGVKTGQPISQPDVQATAQALVQKALSDPTLLTEILLVDSLKQFDKTLYAHVVDTAAYAILVGLQIEWDERQLEKIGVAGLLHDVGYMRLPQNVVKAHWEGRSDSNLLHQHVEIGETLLRRQAQFSSDIVSMVCEHHMYQDGSGYRQASQPQNPSEAAQVLGIVDYFDELLTVGGPSGALPAALAIRRMYQEAQKGKFSISCIEAMIRTFGVFPVSTSVQLSTGELGVVLKQNSGGGLKPIVKVIRDANGTVIQPPRTCDLATEASLGHDVSIIKVVDPFEFGIDPQEHF